VTVVAPDAERSAVGHAITTLVPLRVKEFKRGKEVMGWAINGMPADCVKIGVGSLFKRPPDLVVSGINFGPNTANNVIYSGTVSAATEARILGVPSMAVSLGTYENPIWDSAAEITCRLARAVLAHGLPEKVLLNINVPNLAKEKIKGFRVTRMGGSTYAEDFTIRLDPRNQPYYWLAGRYEMTDKDDDTDAAALDAGWVTITPVSYDLTAYDAIPTISSWRLQL
jgi:5'-nucleotidase